MSFRSYLYKQLRHVGLLDDDNHPIGGGLPASTGANKVLFDDGSTQDWSDSPVLVAILAAPGGFSLKDEIAAIDASGYTVVLAGAGAGNVSNGTHRYKFTYADYAGHETDGSGAPTAAVTVTDHTTDGQVTVSIPVTANSHYPDVKVYRDKNGDGVFKYVGHSDWSSLASFTDNIADADLGGLVPATNTTRAARLKIVNGRLATDFESNTWGSSAFWFDAYGDIGAGDNPTGDGYRLALRGGGGLSGGGIVLYGGWGAQDGGPCVIQGGQGAAGAGGDIRVYGGSGATTKGKVRLQTSNGGADRLVIDENGVLTAPNLPTADPHVVNALWNNSGVVTVSAG